MRQFKLINAAGAEWDLNQRDGFFHAPSNLGFTLSVSALRAGADWLVSEEFMQQATPSGEMVFLSYATHAQFVQFISKNDPLWLMYKPSSTWYRVRCKVQQLSKGEMSNPNLLVCPIKFITLGAWHETAQAVRLNTTDRTGKAYPYAYSYEYADTDSTFAAIKNGDAESPCKLHIFGAVKNPVWVLTQGESRVMSGRVNVTIAEGNKLVINASPTDMEIAEYTRDNVFVRDCYGYSDFSTERFIYAPPGDSILRVVDDNAAAIQAVLEVERIAYAV